MRREKGFILFIALSMLVLMTVIGIALVRAVDTTNEVANNIGFVQSTLISSDSGLEAATQWLTNNPAMLGADNEDEGYYARDVERLAAAGGALIDYTGASTPTVSNDNVDWDGSGSGPYRAKKLAANDTAGNQIAFIVHRLCGGYGSPGDPGVGCARYKVSSSLGGSKGGVAYGSTNLASRARVYYRITVRAKGPRNTASYTQSSVVLEY